MPSFRIQFKFLKI